MVSSSYYHIIKGIGKIIIRVSNHATYLQTWFKSNNNPELSLQNLSVIFTDYPTTFNRKVEPKISFDERGKKIETYSYFIVEQYEYRIDKITIKDFNKIIKTLKSLETNGVFNDPLRKRSDVKANRRVLTPLDINGEDIPSAVDNNRDKEIDASGNIIKDSKNYNLLALILEDIFKN